MNKYYTKDEDAKIIHLKEIENLKFTEIAKFINRSVVSIRARYAKIKGKDKIYYYGDYSELTKMENAVYIDMCENGVFDFKVLATKYKVSALTIKTHYINVLNKKGMRNRYELVYDYWKTKSINNTFSV